MFQLSKEEMNCKTALDVACEYGHKAVAELLILKGAKLNHQNKVRKELMANKLGKATH